MESLHHAVSAVANFLWGVPLILALVGTGVFLTIRLGFMQFRYLPRALWMIVKPPKHDEPGSVEGEISHFQALMTALAATVGTGNIAGVATAIALGGPGAMVWMWLTGLLGMATKYSEALLAIHFREVREDGTVAGGPMYYIEKGLKWRWLAIAFSAFAALAAFGIGNMVQANSVAEALYGAFGLPHWITGAVIAVGAGLVILGGIRGIGRVTQLLVPLMIAFYFLSALVALLLNLDKIPGAFTLIFTHAFTGDAALGGIAGAGVKESLRFGLARGLFSNESGMGTAPIAAAAAKTDHPVSQALISMTQTFIDTLVVCTMTGLVIIISNEAAGGLSGAKLTGAAMSHLLGTGLGGKITAISLALFAFSTILGWCYYGEKSVEYLQGSSKTLWYKIVFSLMVFVGSIAKMETLWAFSDVMNALMALPNLLALVMLSGVLVTVHRSYFAKQG